MDSVRLINYTPLSNVIEAVRMCYNSTGDNLGPKDIALLKRVIDSKHTSTIEHASYYFEIIGISRAVLQELSRHRHASPSVESTRYTLKKLIKGDINIQDCLVMTGDMNVDMASIAAVKNLKRIIAENPNTTNDVLKYAIPEAFKTNERLTINARSLRNLLTLRLSKGALWEIRLLARAMFEQIPEDHMVLFDDIKDLLWETEEKK